ncbi:cytochrome c (plasmid) [Photobacterium sp. DA100]|uniref:c-type cytochrome n=1 Tax=Photobacterium sp. DA100 TaxID=3027472 RepID=UPI002478EC82|nr:cytochrome c [Photobacterium sp. DA100]WEM45492.1 cytochrome c [Photobacterium sp. DA100]
MKKKQLQTVMLSVGLGLAQIFSVASMAAESTIEEAADKSLEHSIAQRQHAFGQIERGVKQAGKELKNKQVHWESLEQVSLELHESSTSLLPLFPEGSQDGSKAKESVWQDKAKFDRLLHEMDKGFEQLYRAATNKDNTSALQGLKQAQSTCKSCHRQYRSRW